MAVSLTSPFLLAFSTNKPTRLLLPVQMGRPKWACRKKGIHPKFYEDAKVYCNGELVMTTGGTMPEYKVDTWSGNHPFYQGQTGKGLLEMFGIRTSKPEEETPYRSQEIQAVEDDIDQEYEDEEEEEEEEDEDEDEDEEE